MPEAKRLNITLPLSLFEVLEAWAEAEKRQPGNLASLLLEEKMRDEITQDRFPLSLSAVASVSETPQYERVSQPGEERETTVALENLGVLQEFAIKVLSHPEFGLQKAVITSAEAELVESAIRLCESSNSTLEQWTELKQQSFYLVGSPVADTISGIAFSMQNPLAAGISGLRDAIEKLIAAHVVATESRIKSQIQNEVRNFLS